MNAFVLAYTGLSLDEVKAEGAHEQIFHPDDLERAWHERQMGLARGEPFDTELRARRRDGQYRWFLVRYHPLRNAANERELIEAALAACKGRVSGSAGAARRLGIPRQTLDARIRALHIDKYKYKTS